MILTIHPSHDYAELDDPKLVIFARKTVTQMGTNVLVFPAPDEPLGAITIGAQALSDAYAAFEINPSLHAAVVTARKALLKLLNRNNRYVDKIAGGDGGIIDQSGYTKTAADSTPAVKPNTPTVDHHSPEGKGHYYSHCLPQTGNTFLTIISDLGTIVTKVGNNIFFSGGSGSVFIDTHPTADMTGLKSGDQHMQNASCNRAGMSDLSAAVIISVP